MRRKCKHSYCDGLPIPRGKYCEKHRTNKRNLSIFEEEKQHNFVYEESKNADAIDTDFYYEESKTTNTDLINQQNKEYENAMKLDLERMKIKEDEDYEKILELSKKEYELQCKKQYFSEQTMNENEIIMIKFSLKNKKIQHIFNKNSQIYLLFDFIDIYCHDNDIILNDYYFITYPKVTITRKQSNEIIGNILNDKQILLSIREEEI